MNALYCRAAGRLHLVAGEESDLWRDSIWGGALRREGAKTNLATWQRRLISYK